MSEDIDLPRSRYEVTYWIDDKRTETRVVFAKTQKEAAEIAAKDSYRTFDESWNVPVNMYFSINDGQKTKYKDL